MSRDDGRRPGSDRGSKRSLRITRHAPDIERDVRDELDFHLEMRTQELVDKGMDPEAAARAARLAFGNRDDVERRAHGLSSADDRRRRHVERFSSLADDARHAMRRLIHEPAFALVAILTLALCIGANVAVFSVVNTVVLRPLPFPEADRLVTFYNSYPGSGIERTNNSVPDLYDRGDLDALGSVALFNEVSATLGEGNTSANVFVSHVSSAFFEVLGVPPAMGRTFEDGDGVPGQNTTVVISDGFWRRHFGGAGDVVGRTLEVEDTGFTVIGVMPADFQFISWDAQLWFPLAFPGALRDSYHRNNYNMIGRLSEGATVDEAQQQLDALNAELSTSYSPDNRQALEAAGFHSVVRGWQDELLHDFRSPLYLLWASVGLILLIGAFNIANLLLLRINARLRELSTRFVLGASRWRIARQLFTESLVLTLIGGALGWGVGVWSQRFLSVFERYQVPRLSEVRPDLATLGFAVLASVAVAGLSATLPALTIRRRDLFGTFRGGAADAPGGPRRTMRSPRNLLVAGQVAAAFILLATGGLLLSSLTNLWRVDAGFETDNLTAGAVLLTADRYPESSDRAAFRERASHALEQIPGIEAAAFATQLPFSGQESRLVFFPEGYARAADEAIEAHYYTGVTPGYFETLGIPLLAGRGFDIGDDPEAPPVVIVDEHLAERYWPGESPLGRRIAFNTQPSAEEDWYTVVGVVGSILQNDLDEARPGGAFYLSAAQSGEVMWRWVTRRRPGVDVTVEQMHAAIRELDAQMPAFWNTTMNAAIAERLIPRRIPMLLVMAFAGVALLLTTLGVYGVLAFAVTQRTRELGIRVALGSSLRGIYRLMLVDVALIIGAGLLAGILGAGLLSRMLESLLYGVEPADPGVFAAAASIIGAVAFFACLIPTRRATRVDPMVALRRE